MGYSTTQKGYYCFDPVLRKQFVSAGVTFFENASYFSDESSPLPPAFEPPGCPFVPSSPTEISTPTPSPSTPLPLLHHRLPHLRHRRSLLPGQLSLPQMLRMPRDPPTWIFI
ncbi:hypothetical protein KSP39_PZI004750 [Platanthera zijinensis]|uniref:Retroviral polymerase SH3-like domain-containing protein n=1 Tax=Platanthera zijinensis TaxID=2320716 RepID=A0AAP0BY25_9ASPA